MRAAPFASRSTMTHDATTVQRNRSRAPASFVISMPARRSSAPPSRMIVRPSFTALTCAIGAALAQTETNRETVMM